MIKHLFPDFLQDEAVYARVERFWIDLWQGIDPDVRARQGWCHPWFEPLPPSISEGNPIFSAVSPFLRRGVRILQYEPTEKGVEFFAYPDTFGGTIYDPDAIHELVISCALSDAAASLAMSHIRPWVANESIPLDPNGTGQVATFRRPPDWAFNNSLLSSAA